MRLKLKKGMSFAKFVDMLNPPYEIPEYMKAFIRDVESDKKYCVCLHRHAGRRTLNEWWGKYKESV